MRLLIASITAAGLSLAGPAGAAVLVQYDFTGDPGNQTTEPAVNVAARLSGLALTRGPGLAAAGAANSFSSSGWSTDTATDYFSFGFTVASGSRATVNQLIFGSQSSGTGPGTINVLAAIDGGAFNLVGTYALQPATNLSQTLTLAPLSALTRLEFRLVAANNINANGTGAIAGAGTFRVTNFDPGNANTAFTIDGSVTQVTGAVPEPATWAMMIAGFGLVGGTLRRRSAKVTFA